MKRQIIVMLVLLFLSVFIFGADSDNNEQELEEKLEQLENQQTQLIEELDKLKREKAKTETQGIYQKEQWGKGAAIEMTIPLSTFFNKPLLLSLSWLFPKIDNQYFYSLGFDFGISRPETSTPQSINESINAGYLYAKFAVEHTTPLLFNFSRTYWGIEFMLGPDLAYDSLQSNVDISLSGGMSLLYTGIEFFSDPKRSFFFEIGSKDPLLTEWDITDKELNFAIRAIPYFGAGLRFYM